MSVKQAENPSATSWPRPAQAETGTRRMYRMINESGENGVTLGQYPSTNNRRLDTETNPDEGIVCTTHIAIHEDYIGPNPENGSFSLQHPWTVNVRWWWFIYQLYPYYLYAIIMIDIIYFRVWFVRGGMCCPASRGS